jgi:hypothetical protein
MYLTLEAAAERAKGLLRRRGEQRQTARAS